MARLLVDIERGVQRLGDVTCADPLKLLCNLCKQRRLLATFRILGPQDSHRASPLLRPSNLLHRNDHQLAPICFSLLSPRLQAYLMIGPILRIDGASQPRKYPTYHTISTVISIYQQSGCLSKFISPSYTQGAREAKVRAVVPHRLGFWIVRHQHIKIRYDEVRETKGARNLPAYCFARSHGVL